MLIRKKRIVGIAGKEGEDLGLLGTILATSLLHGVTPRVSHRLQLPHPFGAPIRHLFPFLTVGIPAQHVNMISNLSIIYRGDPWAIAPSHSSSLRRTTSMVDLGEDFEFAFRWGKHA